MTRDELQASLQVSDPSGYYLDDEGQYFDWSTSRNDKVLMEVGDGAEVAQVEMDEDQVAELHRRLTVWLLNR